MDKNCGNCGKRIIHFSSKSTKMTPCLNHNKCGAWLLWIKEGDENHIEQIRLNRVQNGKN